MAYCRNGVLVFCVFEVGLVSNLEPVDPFVRSGIVFEVGKGERNEKKLRKLKKTKKSYCS